MASSRLLVGIGIIILVILLLAVAYIYISWHNNPYKQSSASASHNINSAVNGYNTSAYNSSGYNATGRNASGYNTSVPKPNPYT